jgi:beta-glucosidase
MDIHEKAKSLVAQMTVVEKASLCSGRDFWYLKSIERLDLPSIMVTDGPHGLRKQASDASIASLSTTIPAVCFPTASAIACSFDRGLVQEIGKAIGEESRQENVAVVLGPGVNMKRSPLCGRNFEYYSEDPFLAGEIAAAFINGVQSQNVGVSMKHFAANNQEKRRMTEDSVMDERTFREIYLPAFEIAVKKAKPWTVMCSYNRLFGIYACQNKRLLTEILRDEWGFDGLVMSDWGATYQRDLSLEAGLDLQMPHTEDSDDASIVEAIENGSLSMEVLDRAAVRVTELILRAGERLPFQYNVEQHRLLARRAAAQSAVLLKNEGNLLPGNINQNAAVIGAFAKHARYQGAGSSKINPIKIDNACDELEQLGLSLEYAEGYHLTSDTPDPSMIDEACKIANGKDIVYVFAGLPDSYEAEGFDRDSMVMPASHIDLIKAVSKINKHVVVILQGGAPMEMVWADLVPSILLMNLGGEASNGACADLLLGNANPGGKLAESWPFTEEDSPSHDYFPGFPLTVEYREGPFIGYRYYDTARKPLRYPFGYGLSYTQFEYSDLELSAANIRDTDTLTVTCTVKNTGPVAGSEIIQLYVSCKSSVIIRAEQELKGFEKVQLALGRSKMVTFTLSRRDFAYYNTAIKDWHVESSDYEVRIGASSRDIRLKSMVHVESTIRATLPDLRQVALGYYDLSNGINIPDDEFEKMIGRTIPPRERKKGEPHTANSTMTDIKDNILGRLLLSFMQKQTSKLLKDSPELQPMIDKMFPDMPLRFLAMSAGGSITAGQIEGLAEIMSGHLGHGVKMMRKKDPQKK